MLPLIVFAAIVVVPVLMALILRVNAVFVFLSICAGYMLQLSLSDSVDLVIATLVHGSNSIVTARLVLLGLPVIITLLMLRRSQGRSLLFQFIPLIFSGMLLGMLVLPLLPPAFAQSVYASQAGSNIKQSSDLVIALSAISNLALAFMLFKVSGHHKKHH